MKTFNKLTALILIISLPILFYTCEKSSGEQEERELEFIVNEETTEALSLLKNAEGHSFSDVCKVVVTIKHADGTETKYNSYELNAYNLNGDLHVQRIALKTGDYQLTEFFMADSSNTILYAVPLEGSYEAQNCITPLPLDFSVSANQVEQVKVLVLSTNNLSLEDFGMARFNADEVETFDFWVGVMDSTRDIFINAQLYVGAASPDEYYNNVTQLKSSTHNLIKVKDGFDEYSLNFTKDNYEMYSVILTNAELKAFVNNLDNEPWIISLDTEHEVVTDIDGNVYQTVTVCGKTWMIENLKTTRFNDGTPIPLYVDSISSVPWPEGDSSLAGYNYGEAPELYGYYYNWYAVLTGKLAPKGWHVPTFKEYKELLYCEDYEGVNGGKLKEKGFEHWKSPNTGATNSTGFTALPGGYYNGSFMEDVGYSGYFWSSTPWISDDGAAYAHAYHLYLQYNSTKGIALYLEKNKFMNVRCVKDY
jgi:uncharacterized protein (TIGR02145 family)